jgi:hypothetical protein
VQNFGLLKEMSEEKENIEVQNTPEETNDQGKEKSSTSGSRPNPVRSFLDGTLLTREIVLKQLPFVIFITMLCMLYIANRYSAEKIVRKTQIIQSELKELRAEQISITSELMQLSQQSEVVKLVNQNELGLVESVEPPKTIIAKNQN